MSLLLAMILWSQSPVAAQGGCEAVEINDRMDGLLATYLAERTQDALGALLAFQEGIAAVVAECEAAPVVENVPTQQAVEATPTSTPMPIPQATAPTVDTGFTIQVTGFARPASDVIERQSSFNPEAGSGEEYVVVVVMVACPTTCDVDYFDFALTGDTGTVYSGARVYYEGRLDVRGAGGSGDLPFLIRADETNLQLLYLADRLNDVTVAYEIGEPRGTLTADTLPEPGVTATPEGGVEVIANANLNVREGPGTEFRIAGSVPAETALVAYGRNDDGTWLRVMQGWVFAELVRTEADVDALAVVEE
jgi:hypothetical protein